MAEKDKYAVSLVNAHTLWVEGITNKELDNTLRSFWELEYLGNEEVADDPMCDRFASTLQVENGRYQVSHPWRITMTFQITRPWVEEGCTAYLKRLQQNPEVLQEYHSIIREQLERDIVEEVKDPEVAPGLELRIYYTVFSTASHVTAVANIPL